MSLKYTFAVVFIMLLVISPWLIRTYLFYPDWRIVRSVGTSHTSELRTYYLEMEHALTSGRVDTAEFNIFYSSWKAMTDKERFDFSFKEDQHVLPVTRPQSETFVMKLQQIVQRWRMAWVESLWIAHQSDGRAHLRPHTYYKTNHMYAWFLISIVAIIFGYMAIPGIFFYFRKTHVILFSFAYFYSIFYFIANDPRRMLPVHLFVLGFSCLGIYYVYCRIKKISPYSIMHIDTRSGS